MATVRHAHICDHCGKRGEEYSAMATCSECLKHTCGNCAEPETHTEDESNRCVCRECATLGRAWADRSDALALAFAREDAARDTTLPSEITPEPETPFD